MANIFGGVEPPKWLQDLTIPQHQGELGGTLGLALGGGLLALQPNESGTGLKGIKQGIAEARLAESDPNWKAHQKQLEGQVVSNWARAATEWQSFDAANKDMAAWTLTDLPALSKYQEELKTDPGATPPVPQSGKGLQALQQIETSRLRKATLDFKKDQAEDMLLINEEKLKNASAASKEEVAHDKKFLETIETVTSDADRAAIREMYKKGDKAGAWNALDLAPKKSTQIQAIEARGAVAEKSEAQKQTNRVALENVRADNKEDLSRLTAEQKLEFDDQRQADRKEIEAMKQAGRVDIEKMKLSRTNSEGKVINRKQFIDRHFNTVFTQARKNAGDGESMSETAKKVEQMLSGVYYRVDKADAAKATAAPPATAADPDAPEPKKVLKWNPETQQLE